MTTVSLKALQENVYNLSGSAKTDKVYASRIKSWTNNLQGYDKYKEIDDLEWIVRNHSKLYKALLKYNKDNKQSPSTLELNVSTMLRIIGLYYGNKDNYLYKYYADILQHLIKTIKDLEGTNTLNSCEEAKGGLIPFEQILAKQKALHQAFQDVLSKQSKQAYDLNQSLLLISLYSLIPPLRNEIKILEFNGQADTININANSIEIHLRTIKKQHQSMTIYDNEIPNELKQIIRESYTLYPRQYVFTSSFTNQKDMASLNTINNRLRDLFSDSKYKVGTNMIRSSYITYINKRQLSYNDKQNVARLMRTSMECMYRNYYKLVPSE